VAFGALDFARSLRQYGRTVFRDRADYDHPRLASTREDHMGGRLTLRPVSLRQRLRALLSEPWWLRGLH
jgi:hypothetical protein